MTVTIKKMSAGKGYEYLLRTVAAGDGDRSLSTPLIHYYTERGTPPGRWMGSGVASLGSHITQGDEVTEDQLKLLIGEGRHPVTGEHLGRAYRRFKPVEHGKQRHPVAGYDFTFSIPKSASVLWAVADGGTQAIIADAHHAAVAEVIDFMEREFIATRVGAKGPKGGVAQLDVTGVIATAFDHYDSRANDPHLHTHVVISNRVMTARDGAWRTVDGTPLHAWVVAVSELHEAVFSDHLTRALGVGWERRPRGRDRNPAWEAAGSSTRLIAPICEREPSALSKASWSLAPTRCASSCSSHRWATSTRSRRPHGAGDSVVPHPASRWSRIGTTAITRRGAGRCPGPDGRGTARCGHRAARSTCGRPRT